MKNSSEFSLTEEINLKNYKRKLQENTFLFRGITLSIARFFKISNFKKHLKK